MKTTTIALFLASAALIPAAAQTGGPLPFGPGDPYGDWHTLVREKNLFPFLVTLHGPDPGRGELREETVRWEVTSIAAKEIEDPEGVLFAIPEHYLRID